jgi:hypothetical protein
MTVQMSDHTKLQNDLLSAFLAAQEAVKEDIAKLARAYKGCIDAGIDMSRYVTKGLGARLLSLAEGRLLLPAYERTLGNDALFQSIVLLPLETQEKLLAEGAHVVRDNTRIVAPLEEVRPSEARRLVDNTGGRPRLLDWDEQEARLVPSTPRHDQLIEMRFTPEEYQQIAHEARKAGQAVVHYLKRQLYETGVLAGVKKRSAARK